MRLIDADAIVFEERTECGGHGIYYTDRVVTAEAISRMPTIEAKPMKHGRWETHVEVRNNTVCGDGVKIEWKRCSACFQPLPTLQPITYCPSCGAEMDLEV